MGSSTIFGKEEVIVLDIETTGFSPMKGGYLIEVAAAKVKNGIIIEEFDEIIKPPIKIPSKITELTGITNEMTKGKRSYEDVLIDFYKFIGDACIIAHNSNFDWNNMLLYYFKKIGIVPTNQVIDSLKLSKRLYPGGSHKLKDMLEVLNIDTSEYSFHRAIDDVRATVEMVQALHTHIENEWKQLSLFEKQYIKHELATEVVEPKVYEYKIKRVSKWEKQLDKGVLQRIYISMDEGNVFYDKNTKKWGVKDCEVTLDFSKIEKNLLELRKASDMEMVCNQLFL